MVSLSSDGKDFVPEEIARRDFSTSFRGFDQVEVRAYLGKVAGELRASRDREAALAERLETAEARAEAAEAPDEAALTAMLGEETTKILESARSIAQEIRTKAETRTAQLVREAQEEATRLTKEADEVKRSSAANAEAVATSITEAAEAKRDKMLADASAEAERIVAEATARATALNESAETDAKIREDAANARLAEVDEEVEAAIEEGRREGREMVAEAKLVRERILADLAQRRNAARAQLEQLRAARERLLEAYGVVRRTLDEATEELAVAMPEARRAAEAAARKTQNELATASVDDVEAEIELARQAGLLSPVSNGDYHEDLDEDLAEDLVEDADDTGLEEEPLVIESDLLNEELAEADLNPSETALVTNASEVLDAMVAQAEEAEAEEVEEAVTAGDPNEEFDQAEPVDVDAGGISSLFARLRQEVPFEHEPEDEEPDVDIQEGDLEDSEDHFQAEQEREAEVEELVSVASSQFGRYHNDERLLELRDTHLDGLARRLTSLLKRALSDDENNKMDLARRLLAKEGVAVVVGEPDSHHQHYTTAIAEVMAEISAAGAEFVGEVNAGSANSATSYNAFDYQVNQEAITQIVDQLVEAFLVPLRLRLDELEDDFDEDEASDTIRTAFRPWRSQVEPLAAASAHAAFNQGVFSALPDASAVRWLNDDGLGPCPDGEDNALAGVLTKGEAFPTGHLMPPAHSRCCCLLVPVTAQTSN